MNRTLKATLRSTMASNSIKARFVRSFFTIGSLMRVKFMKVYSLKPARATIGSSMYWCEKSAYTPTVKGKITCTYVSVAIPQRKLERNDS